MAIQTEIFDGYNSLEGGQNDGVAPIRVLDTQTWKNIGVTLKNRAVSPRPKFRELELHFILPEERPLRNLISYKDNFYNGRIQHVGKYQTEFGEFILYVINGIIYCLNPKDCSVRIILIDDGVTNEPKFANYVCTKLNGVQAFDFYVIFDYPSSPIVIKNFEARRARFSESEVPVSYIGTFVQNRLFVGNAGNEFGASDPVNKSNPDAPISFKDSIVTADNPNPPFPDQFFSISFIERFSNITNMGFLQLTDGRSATGFGPLYISTQDAIHLFQVTNPRDTWEDIQFGSAYIFNYGIVGPNAAVNVNADLFYRSYDGRIYTTQRLLNDQQQWGNTNLSLEIENSLLSRVNTRLLKYSSMGYFDNRIFTTLQPYIVKSKSLQGLPQEDYVFNGLGVLELNNVSGVTSGRSNPVWAGVYPGSFIDMLELDNKFYVIGKDKTSLRNSIYELNEDANYDYVRGVAEPVKSRIYTKLFDFDNPFLDKILTYLYLDIDDIEGNLRIDIYYRTTSTCEWASYGKLNICDNGPQKVSLKNEFMKAPPHAGNKFKTVQFRLDIEGQHYKLNRFIALADLCTDTNPRREFDYPFDGFSEIGDNDLCP